MNNIEFKEARRNLGLTMSSLSKILGVDERTIRRWEAPEETTGARPPNPTASKVMGWMLGGGKPPEWP
jgi:DNA-binding transcriptional regulator YiaG